MVGMDIEDHSIEDRLAQGPDGYCFEDLYAIAELSMCTPDEWLALLDLIAA